MTRAAVIGFGAIGRGVAEGLLERDPEALAAVLVRPRRVEEARAALPRSVRVLTSPAELDGLVVDVVAECAGHEAVREHGAAILERGIDLIVIAVGALADDELRERLARAAQSGSARLLVNPGAIAGLDGLAALRRGRLDRVLYVSAKPPSAWRGTPAERSLDLDRLTQATVLFEGSAREAALLYPKNANVGAAVALAGVGLDRTRVRLVAAPGASENVGVVEADGDLGSLHLEVRGGATRANPKSSAMTAHAILHALEVRGAAIVV